MTTPFLREETIDVLAEIRDAVQEIALAFSESAKSMKPEIVHSIPEAMEKRLRKALQLVRDALDGNGDEWIKTGPARNRLFEVEAILSAELGQPVWEGRRT